MTPHQLFSLKPLGLSLIAALNIAAALPSRAEVTAGSVSAVVPDVHKGEPSALQVVQLGDLVIMGQRFTTDAVGSAQLLLADGSSFTIGPNSVLVIDRFVYDPQAGTAELAASATRGVFRFIGGAASKSDDGVKISTPIGTAGIRGGIADFQITTGIPADLLALMQQEGPLSQELNSLLAPYLQGSENPNDLVNVWASFLFGGGLSFTDAQGQLFSANQAGEGFRTTNMGQGSNPSLLAAFQDLARRYPILTNQPHSGALYSANAGRAGQPNPHQSGSNRPSDDGAGQDMAQFMQGQPPSGDFQTPGQREIDNQGDQPNPNEPPVENPPVVNPPVTNPPVTNPPVETPPIVNPPVTNPPVTNPPVVNPPVINPPVVNPPVVNPPVIEPPAQDPIYKLDQDLLIFGSSAFQRYSVEGARADVSQVWGGLNFSAENGTVSGQVTVTDAASTISRAFTLLGDLELCLGADPEDFSNASGYGWAQGEYSQDGRDYRAEFSSQITPPGRIQHDDNSALTTWGIWSENLAGTSEEYAASGYWVGGIPTLSSDLPTTGVARYSGDVVYSSTDQMGGADTASIEVFIVYDTGAGAVMVNDLAGRNFNSSQGGSFHFERDSAIFTATMPQIGGSGFAQGSAIGAVTAEGDTPYGGVFGAIGALEESEGWGAAGVFEGSLTSLDPYVHQ